MNKSFRFEPSLFCEPGTWIKAGLHCHTLNSDGGLTPEATVRYYRDKGFQCLGITDHAQVTSVEGFSDNDFIGIDSTENGGVPDVIGVGVTATSPKELSLLERTQALVNQGGFTVAAHPTYCAVTPDMYVNCPNLMAMEIYNAYCDEAYSNGLATELWDMVLGQGKRIWGVAADDAHLNPRKRYYSDAGRAWVEIWAEEFSCVAILRSLKRGSFYSTQGPKFTSITVEASTIRLTCSPVVQVRWRTFGNVGFVHYAPEDDSLTQSILPEWFKPRLFVRIELVDSQGKKAWSNPFFIE